MKNTPIKQRIAQKLQQLKGLRPLKPELVKKLREQFSLEMNYNSNAIEGNTLTLRETMLVLQQGITIKNKPLKDHLEAKNQAEAIEYLYNIIQEKTEITEHLIRSIHTLVVQNIDSTAAGTYRDHDVRISGSTHTPPSSFEVPIQMNNLIAWYQENKNILSDIDLAVGFKHRLVAIHPFSDGNGRTSRLVLNCILMQAGYPIVVILKNDRQKYYRALAKADKGDLESLVFVSCQAIERSLDLYLKTLLPATQKNTLLPVSIIAPKTPYSAEYISLLIRKGMIAGIKEGRNWKTSLDAVEDYIKKLKN